MGSEGMKGEIERAFGQPNSVNNWTEVTKFMFSARMDGSSVQEIGLTCGLVLIFLIHPYFFPKLFSVCINTKNPRPFSNIY